MVYHAERPYLGPESDLEFLQAHDNLKHAESSRSSEQGTSDDESNAAVRSHKERFHEIEAHRESLCAAWTTSRHVRRVRVVPKRHIGRPQNEDFARRDEHGKLVRYDLLRWLGHVSVRPPQRSCVL